MASSQYGSLTPLQHYNQGQGHFSTMSFQQMPHPHAAHPQHQHPPTATAAQHIPSTVLPSATPNGVPPHAHAHAHSQPQVQPQLQSQIQPQEISPHLNPTSAPNNPNPPANITPSGTPNLQSQQIQQLQTQHSQPQPQPQSQPQKRKGGRPPKRRRTDDDNPPPAEPAPPPPPTVHPFVRGPYDTLEDAIFSLQLHVFTSGYGVSQKRTVKEKLPSGKYDPEGDIIRKDFACDRGGNEFVSQSRGERRRESRKCGCGWKAAIRRLRRENDRWFVEILEPNHNHPVTPPDEMHTMASYRRWQRENNAGIRTAIGRLTRAAAMPARQIAAYLKGDFRDPDLDRIDKQILRALSMNDKEALPPDGKEVSATVFEMVANRPVIILQENNNGGNSSYLNYSNNNGNSNPNTHNSNNYNNAHVNGGAVVGNSGMGVLIPTTIGGGGL
ncbi:hypothetical protein F5X99DRAFT_241996 [Biscogniauxia marginata]|nr:hypothetical protein F5X99DRAFT_241996 [Biscogniauxia marginata]